MSIKTVILYAILLISSIGGNSMELDSLILNENTVELGDKEKERECSDFLRIFANATRHYSSCIVKYAKPVRICERCTKQYTRVLRLNPISYNQSTCVSDLIRSERFQILLKVYDFQTGVWEDGNCRSK